jgi:hypothetical protein
VPHYLAMLKLLALSPRITRCITDHGYEHNHVQ